MYRGFNVNVPKATFYTNEYFQKGEQLYTQNRRQVRAKLSSFISSNGILQGSEMQENWFPQINADIFISHSHSDTKNAIALAGWLYTQFGINSFIDSCIWGFADTLLKSIDDEYCRINDHPTYSYEKRNNSTSHVHMMLSTALTMMMDKTECLFFLNTPNSISSSEVVDKTTSPWIYYEISSSRSLRYNPPSRLISEKTKLFYKSESLNERKLIVAYDLNLNHLNNIDLNVLRKWDQAVTYLDAEDALDKLYELIPVKENSLIEK